MVFCLVASGTSLFAQTQGVLGKKFINNWSVGVGGGPNIFFGDIKAKQFFPESSDPSEWKFGGVFNLNKQLSHVFSIRGQFLYSELGGTKYFYKDGSKCNEYFNGNVMEGNINGTINFSNLFAPRYNPKLKFFVFGSLGVGISSWITNVKQLNTQKVLRTSNDPDVWTSALVVTSSLGAYYSIHEKVNLGLEWAWHGVNSDWVDVTPGEFHYDAYSMLSFNMTYNFNKYKPGKVPDTNANKIYVPVYIQQPAPAPKPADSTPPKVVTPVPQTVVVDTVISDSEPVKEPDDESLFTNNQEGSFYRVQIFAFRQDKYSAEEIRSRYKIEQEVKKDFSDNWYRFTVGSFENYADAKAVKSQMLKKGLNDAFITRYENGVRISPYGKK